MPNAVICNTGLSKSFLIDPAGPVVNINSFKLGSDFGFISVPADTDVHTLVYTGKSSQLFVSNEGDLYKFYITLDNTIGDFQVGNIGFYLPTGELYILAVLDSQTQKLMAGPNSPGNRKIFTVSLQIVNHQIADVTVSISQNILLPELLDQTSLSDALVSPYNLTILDNQTSVKIPTSGLAMRVDGDWFFNSFYTSPLQARALTINPNLFNAYVNVGSTIYFNPQSGKLELGDGINKSKGIIGVRGNFNDIVSYGIINYTGTNFVFGQWYYADGGNNAGGLTTVPTNYVVGLAVSTTSLVIDINQTLDDQSNAIPLSDHDFNSLVVPGSTVYYNTSLGLWDNGDGDSKGAVGIRSKNNKIIFAGYYIDNTGPYTTGAHYFADSGTNAGKLTTNQNGWYIGTAISPYVLIVNAKQNNLLRTIVNRITLGTSLGGNSVTSGILTPGLMINNLPTKSTLNNNDLLLMFDASQNKNMAITVSNVTGNQFVNQPPVWETVSELGTYSSGSTIYTQLIASDPEGGPVNYIIVAGPVPGTLNLLLNGIISGNLPSVLSSTIYDFTVRAYDSGAAYTDQQFSIIVNPIDVLTPVWNSNISLGTSYSGSQFSKQLNAVHANSYQIIAGIQNLSIDNNGLLSGTLPQVNIDTTITFVIAASNGNTQTLKTFSLIILATFHDTILINSAMNNFSLYQKLISDGWNGICRVNANITVSNVIVGSTTDIPALLIEQMPTNSVITLVNNGLIQGAVLSGTGGTALKLNTQTFIDNSIGTITGGAGTYPGNSIDGYSNIIWYSTGSSIQINGPTIN